MYTMRQFRAPALLLASMAVGAAFSMTTPARGQAVGFGPVIGQFQDGAMMGVTPVATADRRHVRIGGGVAFTGLQGMDVVNVPAAVAGGRGVGGGFRQVAPAGLGQADVGPNGFLAGGMAAPSATTFVADSAVPNGWYGVAPVRPYYGWGYYPPVTGQLMLNAPFGGLGPAPGYGTANMLMPMSNAIRYGMGRVR